MKSTFSDTANCVDVTPCDEEDAVALAKAGEAAAVVVRDSKDPDVTAALVFTAGEWDAFIAGVKAGEFDRDRLA